MATTPPPDIREVLADTGRIAVVGASDDPRRPSYGVFGRLLTAGYDVVPVNPNATAVHGIPAVASLADIEGPVDLVDVFRRAEHTPAIAREAVAIGARGLWLQLGIRSVEARRVAEEAGLAYTEDICLAVAVGIGGYQPAGDRG